MAEFNTELRYLEESIESLVRQTCSDFELIIVDDGGRNDVGSIVDRLGDPRIRVIENDGNRGLVYSLNVAIQNARAEFVVRMDTDDVASPNRVEVLLNFIKENPGYSVVGSLAVEFSDVENAGGILGRPGEKFAKNIIRGDVPIHPSVIFRRKDIIEAGLYDDYHRAEDLALWCKLLLAGKRIYVLPDVLLRYRVNPDDYKKRTLRNRRGEIGARINYYPAMGAGKLDYLFVLKAVVAGLLPIRLVMFIRSRFVLGGKPVATR